MKPRLLSTILLAATFICGTHAMTPAPQTQSPAWATSLDDNIRTPALTVCDDWLNPPVFELGSDGTIEFSFDEMSHEYHRYTCHFDHCNAQWEKSGLLFSEYMEGFDNEDITDWEISQNTNFEYTHYRIVFPNEMNSPKLSGNYMLTVLEDDTPVATFRFCVVETMAVLAASASPVTDIGTRQKHQQITASVATGNLGCFRPEDELRLTVMQNLRPDNAAIAVRPDFIQGNQAAWKHVESMIFAAGNGFRRFEITDVYTNMRHIGSVSYHAPYYHAVIETDAIRRQFYHDGDHNGRFYIRNTGTGASHPDTGTDYVIAHFTLDSPRLDGGSPYLFMQFDAAGLQDRYRLDYDGDSHAYTLQLPLKMGVYDYMYLWVPDNSSKAETGRIESDWYNTPNQYLLLLYLRRPSDRYDRLVSSAFIGSSDD